VRIDLPAFTLVGATTRQGLLTTPLRDRFGIPVRLNFYTEDELEQGGDPRCPAARSRRSTPMARAKSPNAARGTPRIAGRLLRRVRDFASVAGDLDVDAQVADAALTRLEVDSLGLDAMDRRYLTMIAISYRGGPVGVETLAAGLSEPRDTIEEVIEPYLIQLGLIARTARGRCLNEGGWRHLGLDPPGGMAGRFVRQRQVTAPLRRQGPITGRHTNAARLQSGSSLRGAEGDAAIQSSVNRPGLLRFARNDE
jgi:holliday junction DNA helicase RuvB